MYQPWNKLVLLTAVLTISSYCCMAEAMAHASAKSDEESSTVTAFDSTQPESAQQQQQQLQLVDESSPSSSERELWTFSKLFRTAPAPTPPQPQMTKWVKKNATQTKWNGKRTQNTITGETMQMWTKWSSKYNNNNNNGNTAMWKRSSWQKKLDGTGGVWQKKTYPKQGSSSSESSGTPPSGGLWGKTYDPNKNNVPSNNGRPSNGAKTGTWSGGTWSGNNNNKWKMNVDSSKQMWTTWKRQKPLQDKGTNAIKKTWGWGARSSMKSMKNKSMKSKSKKQKGAWSYGYKYMSSKKSMKSMMSSKGLWAMKSGKGYYAPIPGKGKGLPPGKGKGKGVDTPTIPPTLAPSQFPSVSALPSLYPSVSNAPSESALPSFYPSEHATDRPTINGGQSVLCTREQLRNAVDIYFDVPEAAVMIYGQIRDWNVSCATDFSELFSAERNPAAVFFDESLTNWDTRNAVTMKNMFKGAALFNGDITTWDVSNVQDFSGMFAGGSGFNQDLSSWNVESGTNFASMFEGALEFNRDVSPWSVQNARSLRSMFEFAFSFSQDLCSWGARLRPDADTTNMFLESICEDQTGPILEKGRALSFCAICGSMAPSLSSQPSLQPSLSSQPSLQPSLSSQPSLEPSLSSQPSLFPSESMAPSLMPSLSAVPSLEPSISALPSLVPSLSSEPSLEPSSTSIAPSESSFPSFVPTESSVPSEKTAPSSTEPSMSMVPSQMPSDTFAPTSSLEEDPSEIPSSVPSAIPSTFPSGIPSSIPSVFPSSFPSAFPSAFPSEIDAVNVVLQPADIEWNQIGEYAGFEDGELFGVSLSLSDDGSYFLAGAYEYSEEFISGGRIELINHEDGTGIEALGQAENDAFGFAVSMSGDAETNCAIRTSDGVLEIFDGDFNLRQEIDAGLVSFTSVFQTSRDGNWIVIAGDEIVGGSENDIAGPEVILKAKVYEFQEVYARFVQYGGDIEIETVAPFGSYMIDITDDGSAFVVSTIGDMQEFNQVGSYWAFGRDDEGKGYSLLGDRMISSDRDDGFGQTVQIVVTESDDLMTAVGIPMFGRVVIFTYSGTEWDVYAEIDAGVEFNSDAEFGYAISLNENGSRLLVGARCFASESSGGCDGAVQTFDLKNGEARPVGSILAGPEYSFFGEAVSMSADGTTFAVGAPEDCLDLDCPGSVYLFEAELVIE
eukprot:scaffold294_cov221-Amphora_coffeaeformis.AAC.60